MDTLLTEIMIFFRELREIAYKDGRSYRYKNIMSAAWASGSPTQGTSGPHLCLYSSLRITVVERVRVVRRFSAAFPLTLHVRAGFSRRNSLPFDYTNS
jgi:hypothetical protein